MPSGDSISFAFNIDDELIYFSKGKSGRKGMFTKVTWFGIPLN